MAAWIVAGLLGTHIPTLAAGDATGSEIMGSPDIAGESGTVPNRDPAMVRITSSFELTHASAVLRQVARLFSAGFVRQDAEQIAHLIDSLPSEQSRSWDFSGIRKGVAYPLRVRARIDAFGTLDLDFFAPAPVAGAVREAVDGYLNARGL